jgi:xanthine dehydrogenase YagR molybdenum-binding subunit
MSCRQIRARIDKPAVAFPGEAFAGKDPSRLALADGMLKDPDGAAEPLAVAIGRVSNGAVEANAENIPHGVTSEGMRKLYRDHVVLAGGAMLKDCIQFAFGVEFVEVRGCIRAPGRSAVRALSAPLPRGRSSIR